MGENNIVKLVERVKEKNGENTLVLVREGEAYISINADAEKVAEILGYEIIKAETVDGTAYIGCQISAQQANEYVQKLCNSKHRVALVDELVGAPREVKRDISLLK